MAAAENVRAALLLVSRGDAPLGIVYYTDALADTGVVTVDTFPESTHSPITYPIALTTGASPNAAKDSELSREPCGVDDLPAAGIHQTSPVSEPGIR